MENQVIEAQLEEKVATYSDSFNGKLNIEEAKKAVSVKEALTTADANILMPKVIQQVVTEAAEGQYLASQFFKRINLSEGRSMEFIHFGAIRAFEIGEGQEYPEQSLNLTKDGIGSVDVKVRKYGLKVSITDEMISDSQWDVIGLHLQAAGRALARLKEENLRWGDENATMEEIRAAADAAQADGFVNAFTDGYNMELGQGGVNVSGGQKQRLCIARALLKKPKILILDDSTSAVDTATEAKIRQAFTTSLKHSTKIIIAQRITSVIDADKIIVLEDGKIIGMGNHNELMKNCEEYRDIYYSQTDKEKEVS